MNIVLLEPEIPANTGNIGRTCVATNTVLHLIRPLGFSTDDKALKRAGLDYWSELDVRYYDSFDEFTEKNKGAELYFATTKAERTYADVSYSENTYIMFGKESAGIPEEILVEHRQQCIRIPMYEDKRSLNLSNSAAIILYETFRQNDFKGLEKTGALHRLCWK
ncbi:MAG: tRNA (uridine(34)/cytosine(34)/5-carboxymethylaminomethyluridine(34)-2'-O)-methyltransferase TrmL [Clostridiales bacterium]|nr:tRNA (uridine(34)/cytosine(34)/5-carboxymethylaminomethyluridine(34)-2'-O)-methyltransferase TrmL [Clostridiales bacterium]